MPTPVSPRIAEFVNALPLEPGLRVLEIGCGPGVAAREVSRRIGSGFILGVDRSSKAIDLALKGSAAEMAAGRLGFREIAIEDFQLGPELEPFDIAFAMRVGALDGRHPEAGKLAIARIKQALKFGGHLFIDGAPIREIYLGE